MFISSRKTRKGDANLFEKEKSVEEAVTSSAIDDEVDVAGKGGRPREQESSEVQKSVQGQIRPS